MSDTINIHVLSVPKRWYGPVSKHVQHDLVPEDVIEFWRVMLARYNTRILNINDPADNSLVQHGLSRMGVTDPNVLQNYAITFGTAIYLPFTPGKAVPKWPLWDQIKTCLHEHFHVARSRQFEGVEYGFIYQTNSTSRAYFEGEAYRTQLVLEWRYKGKTSDPEALAEKLRAYKCNDSDISMVAKILRLSLFSIKRGAVPDSVTQFACDWLDARFAGEEA